MNTATDKAAIASHAIDKSSQGKYAAAIMAVQHAKDLVAELAADDEIGAFLLATEAMGHLHQCIQYLTYAKPKCLCRFCEGSGISNQQTCATCKGHGWLPAGVAKQIGS